MRQTPAADRLEVWTYVHAGEEIVHGDPSVTDEERAAAGRETVAGRTRELTEANRRRAAAQYDSGGLPADQDVLRVWYPRDPAALRSRLGDARLTAWAEDDILHVLWQGRADRLQLAGGLEAGMWPVDGSEGLWEASLRIRRLDEAVISILVFPLGPADLPFGHAAADTLEWRGPHAPQAPSPRTLTGAIREHAIESAALGGSRAVTVYVPPDVPRSGRLPCCVLADGQSARGFAEVLEPAIVSGDVPPVLLVGIHSATDPAREWPDLRSQEYLPGNNRRRFAAHLSFVTDEVVPWAAGELPVARTPWVSAGFSNGAAWAIGAAQRRPDMFGGVAALSAGVVPRQVGVKARAAEVRHYLAAGTLETAFRDATREWARRLGRAGLPYRHHEWTGGHDPFWWNQQLPVALAWLLTPYRGTGQEGNPVSLPVVPTITGTGPGLHTDGHVFQYRLVDGRRGAVTVLAAGADARGG
jgi:enterochelin esterase-like enzyme